MEPEIRYCTSADGTRIAYTVYGRGQPALVFIVGWGITFQLEAQFDEGIAFYQRLSEKRMVVRYDPRGIGASSQAEDYSTDAHCSDAEAVISALELETYNLFGTASGSPIALLHAHRHSESVRRIVLWEGWSAGNWEPKESVRAVVDLVKANWPLATRMMTDLMGVQGEDMRRRWARLLTTSIEPNAAIAYFESRFEIDVTDVVGDIAQPALLLHRRGNIRMPIKVARELASQLPNARFVELPGKAEPWILDHEDYLAKVEEFLGEDIPPDGEPRAGEQKAELPTQAAPAAAVRRKGAAPTEPRIQYVKTEDGVNIAYWTMGEGEPLVHVPLPFSHIQLELQIPEMRRWYEGLARKHTLVRYDHRGFGLSDRTTVDMSLPTQVRDLEALIEKLGFETFALFGPVVMGPIAIEYAARHPEKVSHLFLWCSWASYSDYLRSPRNRALVALRDQDWETYTEAVAHTMLGWAEGEPSSRYAALMRESVSAEAMRDGLKRKGDKLDLPARLERVKSPTLVLHRREVALVDVEVAQGLASRIPNAQLALLEGDSAAPFLGDTQSVLDAIDDFLSEGEEATAAERQAGPPAQPAPAAAIRRAGPELMEQELGFCTTSDGVSIAYATVGDGPPLVYATGLPGDLSSEWEVRHSRELIEDLAQGFTLIRYDMRGSGLSDREPGELSFDNWILDLEAVVDHLHLEGFPLLSLGFLAGPICIAYAAAHPERVSHLIMSEAYIRGEDLGTPEQAKAMVDFTALYGIPVTVGTTEMSADDLKKFQDVTKIQKQGASLEVQAQVLRTLLEVDVSSAVEKISMPTLIMHSHESQSFPFRLGRDLAAAIPQAKFVPFEEPISAPWIKQERITTEIRRFLGVEVESKPKPTPEAAGMTQISSPPETKTFASGRYVVERLLGQGAQKSVYLVDDTVLGRQCALSMLNAALLDPGDVDRIKREAQTLAQLGTQPNIVTVHDYGEEDGTPFIVCEYVPGGELRDELNAAAGPLPLERALTVAIDICRALSFAHGRDIVHRDLKPENVWLTEERSAKLGDFGIALSAGRTRLTMPGGASGTPLYMAPEQASGGEIDARTDLYAFGVLLYELVTGRPPFVGDDPNSIMYQHVNTEPASPVEHNESLPPSLERLIMRLLAKAPGERPVDAEEVGAELRRIRESPTEEPADLESDEAGSQVVPWGQFIGRREEMDQLKAALGNALSGRGSVVMLVGEPGIGKTRLAEEFGVYASLRGVQTLSGSCFEGGAAPYRPFVEAVRQYVNRRPDAELRHELGEGAPEVAKLVSEIRQRFPDIPEAPALEPDAERLRLFESVTSFIRTASEAKPLVLFLDDIHWADKPSLLLLRYLAGSITSDRVLVLGAYRDVELDRTHPLSDVIAAMRQDQTYQRVRLRGLPEEDILGLLTGFESSEEATTARRALATALAQETEGNPFFIREVLNHLVEERKLVREGGRWTANAGSVSEFGIPEGVRQVIGRRLSRLSEPCNRMLTLASTMTGGFSWDELRAITEESDETLLELVEEALRVQIIRERKNGQVTTFEFTHALVRHTVYEELSTPRRVMLHRQIGEALEELHAANSEPHLAGLAHHFYQAAPGGDVHKAIDYLRRAAERATAHFAWEEAVAHYQRALQVTDLLPAPDERLHVDLLLALVDARLAEGGDDSHRQESALRAADIAREIGDTERFALSVLAFAGPHREDGVLNPQLVALLEEGLSLIGAEDGGLRAKLLVRLSAALFFGGDRERDRRQALTNEALAIARRLGDKEALIYVLRLAVWGWDARNAENQVANGRELLALADEVGDKAMTMAAHEILVGPLLEQGNRDGADAAIDAYIELQPEVRRPGWGMTWRAMQADLDGRTADAEQLLGQGYAELQKLNPENAEAGLGIQLIGIRRAQGRLMELEAGIRQSAEQFPAIPGYRAALCVMYAEAGRLEDARAAFGTLADDDFAGIPFDRNWPITMFLLADACTDLGDARRAGTLYNMLLPYQELCVVTTLSMIAIAYAGSLHRPLGGLATTMSRWANAERHYEAAIAVDLRMRAAGWVARAQLEYARMLALRAEPGDREKARELLSQASDSAQELGMKAVVDGVDTLRAELDTD